MSSLLLFSLLAPAADPVVVADLVVHNAKVWTGEEAQPWAQALVIDGAQLAMVGTNEDARKANAAQVVDLPTPPFEEAKVMIKNACTRAHEHMHK